MFRSYAVYLSILSITFIIQLSSNLAWLLKTFLKDFNWFLNIELSENCGKYLNNLRTIILWSDLKILTILVKDLVLKIQFIQILTNYERPLE